MACLAHPFDMAHTDPRFSQSSPSRRPNHRIEWSVVCRSTLKAIRAASPHASVTVPLLIFNRRLLRFHVHPLLHALLPRPPRLAGKHVGRAGIHAIWALFRLHGRQGRPLEGQKQSNGTRVGLLGRSGTYQVSFKYQSYPPAPRKVRK